MDGFTPTFFLQLLIAVGSAGAVYGAIRADLSNMQFHISEEKRLREALEEKNHKRIHDVRDMLQSVNARVSFLEGMEKK